jgi:hypothetical protein
MSKWNYAETIGPDLVELAEYKRKYKGIQKSLIFLGCSAKLFSS